MDPSFEAKGTTMTMNAFVDALKRDWQSSSRWAGITRPYGAEDVWRLRGSVQVEHTIAKLGASRLWRLLHDEPYVHSLSAVTGNQAIQHVAAGLKAIYVSGWQVAADANNSLQMYPDQSLYPSDSVPYLLKRINNALQQADLIHHLEGHDAVQWFVPLVAVHGGEVTTRALRRVESHWQGIEQAMPRRFQQRYWLHALLFLLTVYSTTLVGARFSYNFAHNRIRGVSDEHGWLTRAPPDEFVITSSDPRP